MPEPSSPLKLALLATALLFAACSEGPGSLGAERAQGRFAIELPERTFVPERPTRIVTQAPLSQREALEDPDNLLREDPAPLHPPNAIPGGRLSMVRPTVLAERYNWVTENYVQVHEIHDYVGERVARRHRDDPHAWAPQLAERVTRSADGRVYTVELRRGARWHRPFGGGGGAPAWLRSPDLERDVTAHDFVFTFEMLSDPRVHSAAPLRSWYSELERIEVVDRHTVRFHWRRGGLAAELWTMWFAPIPRFIFAFDEDGQALADPARQLERHFYRWPIGSGPYRLADEVPGEMLLLERNPEYQGVEPPLDEILLQSMPAEAIADALERGSVDVARLDPSLYLSLVERSSPGSAFGRGRFDIARVPTLGYDYIVWNMREPLTADVRVRRALTLAFNRELGLDLVLNGLGRVRSGPSSPLSPYHDPDLEPWPFDLAEAAQLLDEAGVRDVDGDGWRDTVDRSGRVQRAVLQLGGATAHSWPLLDMFVADLALIGLAAEWTPAASRSETPMFGLHGLYGAWSHDWEDDPFQVFHSSQAVPGGSNFGGWANARADRLIERIRTEQDHERRVALHRELHRVLHEEQPYTFLLEPQLLVAWGPRVRGVHFAHTPPHDLALSWWLEP